MKISMLLNWDGSTLTEAGKVFLGQVTDTSDGADCDAGCGCDTRTGTLSARDITGDGDYIYVTAYYGLLSYSFDGTTFTLEDSITDYHSYDVDHNGDCYGGSRGWRWWKCHIDSSGYLWALCEYKDRPDEADQDQEVRVYSISGGNFTLQDEIVNTSLSNINDLPSPDDDGTYTYVGTYGGGDWVNMPVLHAYQYTGGVIVEKGSTYNHDMMDANYTGRSIHCNNGYIYYGINRRYYSDAWSAIVYSFDGTDFSEDYVSFMNNPQEFLAGEYPWVYTGKESYRVDNIYDMYTTSVATATGTITNVAVTGVMYTDGITQEGELLISSSTSCCTFSGTAFTHSGDWALVTRNWTTNPSTSSAWTWSEIDDLNIGLKLGDCSAEGVTKCSQLYATVSYEATANPEIRTTQVYAEIGYTPSTASSY